MNPSLESWIWHLAERVSDHCGKLGTKARDISVEAFEKPGVLRVRIFDTSLRERGKPFCIVDAALPLPASTSADRVVAGIYSAILIEVCARCPAEEQAHAMQGNG